jgi:2-O-methyltransferase
MGSDPVSPDDFDRTKLRDGKPLQEFRRLLPRRPTIIEIGAHDGSTTEGLRRLFPRGRILAFEPEPRAIVKFRARPALKAVTLVESAVSDRNGETIFYCSGGRPPGYVGDEWDASGSIRKPTGVISAYPWIAFNRQIVVPVVPLDDEVKRQQIDAVDLIWVDVQGAEKDVIRGASETLKRTHYLYTECIDYEEYENQLGLQELRDLLPDFEVIEVFAYDVLLKNKHRPAARWFTR